MGTNTEINNIANNEYACCGLENKAITINYDNNNPNYAMWFIADCIYL